MHFSIPLLITALLMTGGCAIIPSRDKPAERPVPHATSPDADPRSPGGFLSRLSTPLTRWQRKTPQPPKAQPLRKIGTVRTLSKDGSYAIVELEPGMMVAPGTELLITATGGDPSCLKVAEIQPPYFVADIVNGRAEPGDRVQQ